jgi:hypothetical protein
MLDVYRDLLDELLSTPSEMRQLLAMSDARQATPEIRRLIASIRDRDQAVISRAQSMTRQEMPYLTAMSVSDAAADQDLDTLFAEMEASRGDLVSMLINLSLRDWERGAIDETAGEITLADEIERHVEFDEAQRRRLREMIRSS